MTSSRNRILERLKKAQDKRGDQILVRPNFTSPIYHNLSQKLADSFQANLELAGGTIIHIKNLNEAAIELKKYCALENFQHLVCLEPTLQKVLKDQVNFETSLNDLEKVNVGISTCEFLIAHLGSILVSSASPSGRRLHVFPETHIVIAHKDQIKEYLEDGLAQLEIKYPRQFPSMITNITGPSRTADIEKTLVMGMHGPKKLIVLLAAEPF